MDKLESAQLDWIEGSTPFSKAFDDFYYALDNGLAEVDHIFIQHNDLSRRFEALKSKKATQKTFCIAETGFGTGLNFLRTLAIWQDLFAETSLKNGPNLHFVSFEKFPLSSDELSRAHQAFPQLKPLSDGLISAYPMRLPGWHDVDLFGGRVRLTLWFGDVLNGLPAFDLSVDAWFLDGFTPSKNPQMWQPELYGQMARLSHAETTFATFTAAGHVRRGLAQAGFEVRKDDGYGTKREMCFGLLSRPRTYSSKKPWFDLPPTVELSSTETKTACVIGAGLAGATVAYQLAEQGWRVTVLEAEGQAATLASGNLAGAIHPLVTADWNLRSEFYFKGFEATLKWLSPWLDDEQIEGALNGLMQLAVSPSIKTRLKEALDRVGLPQDFASWCSAEQASEKIGTQTPYSGMFFERGGWVYPASVVAKCLTHPNIDVQYDQSVKRIEKKEEATPAWQILTATNRFSAKVVVVASGALDDDLNQFLGLPIRPVKGQVSHLRSDQQQTVLKTTVTHQGYTCRCVSDQGITAVTGATFEAPDMSEALSEAGHDENLSQATQAMPDWLTAPLSMDVLQGKVGFRPTTPDHLPLVGPIVDAEWAERHYYSQSHTHAVFRYPEQVYQPGLFVSNGHGARGLMSVFLAAEIIGGLVEGSAPIMPNYLYDACHPERFRIRVWRSGKKQLSFVK